MYFKIFYTLLILFVSINLLTDLYNFYNTGVWEPFGIIKEGKIEQRELKLFIDNDSRLYRQRFLPIMRNLSNKMMKDKYKASLAERAFMYLVNDGVKKYISDFGGDRDTFSRADKKAVAKEYVKEFEEAYDSEEYDFMGRK